MTVYNVGAGSPDKYSIAPGDEVNILANRDDDVELEAGTTGAAFDLNFANSNSNDFKVTVKDELQPNITIDDGVDIGDVDLDLKDAGDITINAGDDVSLGKLETGEGADTITFGDGATVELIDADNEGSQTINIADDITFGNDATVGDVSLGDGDDTLTFGDDATLAKVDLGDGDDQLVIGDDATIEEIKADGGDEIGPGDAVTIGDGASIEKIDLGNKSDDTLTTGDDIYIVDLDMGGTDNDVANIGTFDRAQILAGSKDIKLDGGEGSDRSNTTDVDSITLDFSWLTGYNGDPSLATGEYKRFLDELEDEGYADTNGDGVYTIQEGDPSADPSDSEKIEFELDDGTKFTLEGWERIGAICFVRGTRIVTARGEVAIEELAPGDKVLTMDSGYQDIRWIGSSRVSGLKHLAPVRIKAGAFNNVRDVLVSPQHRILLKGGAIEMLYGESEALVAAKHLVNGDKVVIEERVEVDYFHMLFDDHQIVFAEGMASESFHPGAFGIDTLAEASRQEIFELFPELEEDLAAYGAACRTSLKAHEAVLAANYGRAAERV